MKDDTKIAAGFNYDTIGLNINSEDDIPKDILDKIKNENVDNDTIFSNQYFSGKKGRIISDEYDIKKIFSDEQDFYFGHGTLVGEDGIDSILDFGLYVKNPEEARGYGDSLRGLASTVIEWKTGSENLFDHIHTLLDNWPHKQAKNIVIVELPNEYILHEVATNGGDPYEAFYLQTKNIGEFQGYRLRPEFIKGVYNSHTHSFTENENFYKNLNDEQLKKLFTDVKRQFIRTYAQYSTVSPENCEHKLPLNENEMKLALLEWYKFNLKKLQETKKFKEEAIQESHSMNDSFSDDDWEKGSKMWR